MLKDFTDVGRSVTIESSIPKTTRSSINTLTAKSRHVSNTAVTSDPDTGNISFRTDSGAHSSKNSAVNGNGNGNSNSPVGDIEE